MDSKKLQTFAFSYRESRGSNLTWSTGFETSEQAETAREAFAEVCGGWRGVDGSTADGTVIYTVEEEA